ncbi:VOC family protein [Bacillus sp. AK031]
MKWHHAGIETGNLEVSAAFYKEVFLFEAQSCFKLGEERIIFMKRGEVTIELIQSEGDSVPSSLHFAWEVDDLSAWVERLEEYGMKPVEGPYSLDSGLTVIFYKGADGEVIELVSRQ